MGKKIASILLIVLATLTATAQTPDELMKKGNDAYQNGQYQAAAQVYTSILEQGFQSADLYYNLGNAYYRQNEYGQAVLNYERALRLKPNFRDARENLALAESKTEDHIEVLPELFITQWARAVVSWLSPAGWRVVVLLLLVVLGVLTTLFFLSRQYGWRKGSLVGGGITLLLFLLCLGCAIASHVRYNRHTAAVVTSPMVVVKSSPEDNGVDKFVLHEGTKVRIAENLGDWNKVRLSNGETGWLQSPDITII